MSAPVIINDLRIEKDSPHMYYWQISQKIKEAIYLGNHKKGDKLPSERDLAVYFGTSRMTVRSALNMLVEENLLVKRNRQGIYVAREIQAPVKTRKIGLTVWHEERLAYHPGTLEILRGINRVINPLDIRLEILPITAEIIAAGDYADAVDIGNLDGLILIVQEMPERHVQKLKDEMPLVIARREESNCVYIDYEEAAFRAAEYLLQLDHRRIALLNGPASLPVAQETLSGYLRALQVAGLSSDAVLVTNGYYNQESGAIMAKALLKMEDSPTAMLAGDDFVALGILETARKAGLRCPDDLSILSFGNFAFSKAISPALTTVHFDYCLLGQELASMLLKVMSPGKEDCPAQALPGNLLFRESSARLSPAASVR